MLKSSNKCIGITLGDPGGIGPEVISKALQKINFKKRVCVLAHPEIFKQYRLKLPPSVSWYFPDQSLLKEKISKGKPSRQNAAWALGSLQLGVHLLKSQEISSLVTAPLSKEGVAVLDPGFIGHTEFLAKAFDVPHVDMMFSTPHFKTVIVTRHDPVKKLPQLLTQKRIEDCVALTYKSLQKNFKIRSPKIALCGFNPHAGEGGLIGREEQAVIIPAIRRLKQRGISVKGPFAADTLFIPEQRKAYDCIIAMYHDQGLIPIKTLYFDQVVNVTIGLPFARTSPAHGTAYSLAGKNKANPLSMIRALELAHQLT